MIALTPPPTETSGFVRPIMRPERDRVATATTLRAMEAEDFIRDLAEGPTPWISRQTAQQAVEILANLGPRIPGLPVPTIAPGPDGLVGFTWRSRRHYVNIEVHADRHVEVFHENLETGELWSIEGITAEVAERLRLTV